MVVLMEDENHKAPRDPYPPIAEYGFISDCHSMALVCTTGSIDWCVMPRVDAHSVFGRILDWEKGGYCQIRPNLDDYQVSRRYLDDTLVLETTFKTDRAAAKLYDCFAMRPGGREDPYNQIIRIVEGLEGKMPLHVALLPRFDYGLLNPWIRHCNEGRDLVAIGGHQGLLISGDVSLDQINHKGCTGSCIVREGEKKYLSIIHRPPHKLDSDDVEAPHKDEVKERFEKTIDWWREWTSHADYDGAYRQQAVRSAVVLKGLTNAPTGAIAAAATTSLPEEIGGWRNWDYRFTWVRDSVFTVRALAELGFFHEADGFRRFVERTAAGSAEEVQIMFGVGGERHLPEREIPELDGYRGSKPVRVGNAAANQMQHDVFGELLDLAYNWHLWGNDPDDDYWEFIVELLDRTIHIWREPDHGLWEIRGEPRHFVQSKAMCWAALDCGIRLAEETGRDAPVDKWKSERKAVRDAIHGEGYDSKRGVYTQAFGRKEMDASLLLLPMFRFVAFDDERMLRTTDAVWNDLGHDGLIMRYAADSDGMAGREGTFLCCTFWLAEVLARQKRIDEARRVFEDGCATANDLRLFAEEFDVNNQIMLGNFPQGLTHLSLISAAVAIGETERESSH